MKILIQTACIVLLLTMQLNSVFAQHDLANNSCKKFVTIDDRDICLPEIAGMIESYDIPEAKLKADKFENPGNTILGFYLTEELYGQVDKFDEIVLDEYFKIYIVNNMKDKEYASSDLNEMGIIIENNFLKDNWDILKSEAEKNRSDLTIGQPVIFESYFPDEQTKSYLMIVKIQSQGVDHVMLISMNIILVKEKIIWLACYKKYEGQETAGIFRSNNDSIVSSFKEVNR